MDINKFWEIIEQTHKSDAEPEEALRQILEQLSPEEILSFRTHFIDCMDRAFHWDIWAAAYIISGSADGDTFMDFRSGLISLGHTVFEAVLQNPENILTYVIPEELEDCFFEEFQYVAADLYEAKTGQDAPHYIREVSSDPEGQEWDTDINIDELRKRFPKLAALF